MDSDLLGNLLSAVISGGITGYIFHRTLLWEKNKISIAEENEVNSLLTALRAEINAVLSRYKSTGDQVEKIETGQPFASHYRVTQDYFCIYHAMASHIGKLKDEQLRTLIVETYTNMKSHVENFSFNNAMLEGYERLLSAELSNRELQSQLLKSYEDNIKSFGEVIRESHFRVTSTSTNALKKIDEYLEKSWNFNK